MTAEDFDFLLGKVKHLITKQDTKMRLAIPPRERMSLTLRFLATGWCDCISKLNEIYVFLIIVHFNVCLCMFCNFSFCLIQVNHSSP